MALYSPRQVIYFAAVMYDPVRMPQPESVIERLWGPQSLRSDSFDFSHTNYYAEEMGTGLRKYFTAFGAPASPEYLPGYKLAAGEYEQAYAVDGRRIINIDPGYLAAEKIVVASTKNFTHRIYIGNGIYGDLQLMRGKDGFFPMQWTYGDYKRAEVLAFFERLYAAYKEELDAAPEKKMPEQLRQVPREDVTTAAVSAASGWMAEHRPEKEFLVFHYEDMNELYGQVEDSVCGRQGLSLAVIVRDEIISELLGYLSGMKERYALGEVILGVVNENSFNVLTVI
jgi:hypothetical protein